MARKKRSKRRLNKSEPYFIVEGYTEENYIKLLKNIYGKSAEIKNVRGGNAKGVIEKALQIIDQHIEYSDFIVWFDNDGLQESDEKILSECKKKAKIVQSYPCIESWLLAHFATIYENQINKSNCKCFENQLKNFIKNYEKNNYEILKNNINKEKINNAIENYPKFTNNLEYILIYFFDLIYPLNNTC